jgi:hypothetical protein
MPITVYPDRIDFTNYSLRLDSDGVRVTPVSSPLISGTFQAVSTTEGLFQGTVSGYATGGTAIPGFSNIIDKFSFSADANATDVGDLTQARVLGASQSSSTHGFKAGGYTGPGIRPNTIDKFTFSSNANAIDHGDLAPVTAGQPTSGQSSTVHGYATGGWASPDLTQILRFPFATNVMALNVGSLTRSAGESAGQSSIVSGYTSGTYIPPLGPINTIDKFPFATAANATDVGDLTQPRGAIAGNSSSTHGYNSGGATAGVPTLVTSNVIDRFPFATNANATDVGDLSQTRSPSAGQSSTTSGHSTGGSTTPTTYVNTIDKFPFASAGANATDVGDLTVARAGVSGNQY